MNEPLVSVLMTAYNRERYIAEAIESVLASTWQDFELIIVDDGSRDRTLEIAREYESRDSRIRVYVNESNLGDYPNRNRAASYAGGEYLKFLDSDDYIYPHGLAVMLGAMEKFPEAGFGLSSVSDPQRPYPVKLEPVESYREHFGGYGHFDRAPGSGIIRRSAFEMIGGFSGKRMIGDNELWFKLGARYPLVKFPRDLVWDRTHPGQESRSDYAKQYDELRKAVLEEALNSAYCPLSDEEKKEIQKKALRRKIKTVLKRISG